MNLPPAPTHEPPLPVELTGRADGWAARYRRYPVFSRPWALGRIRVWGGVLLATALAVVGTLLITTPLPQIPWGALLHLLLLTGLPLILGPLAAAWVRRRWRGGRRETALLAATLLGVVAAVLLLSHLAGEPMKQAIAERTGGLDADGKRRRLVLTFGIHLQAPEVSGMDKNGEAAEPPLLYQLADLAMGSAVLLWLAGGAALWGVQRERQGLAALQRERELAGALASRREAEMRLSVLAAQVEPHFLFNTLAGVRSAIATDPARASEMVDRLVEYLRAAIPRLRSGAPAQATVAGQFEIVRAYLGLMAARMPRLRFGIHLPGDLRDACCPPLMLISLAENAVKHGVEPKMGPVRIEVRAERQADGRLRITVADDGVGFGDGSHAGSGLGLANIRERLVQLFPGRAELTLQQRAGGGVAASLVLPLEWPLELSTTGA
jgi:Histidine kinase/Histidine kinase-, DNA gyrase B-, and HSP90-like ATPase